METWLLQPCSAGAQRQTHGAAETMTSLQLLGAASAVSVHTDPAAPREAGAPSLARSLDRPLALFFCYGFLSAPGLGLC